jgi:hypothetical protein
MNTWAASRWLDVSHLAVQLDATATTNPSPLV